jgi:hypothetical protein
MSPMAGPVDPREARVKAAAGYQPVVCLAPLTSTIWPVAAVELSVPRTLPAYVAAAQLRYPTPISSTSRGAPSVSRSSGGPVVATTRGGTPAGLDSPARPSIPRPPDALPEHAAEASDALGAQRAYSAAWIAGTSSAGCSCAIRAGSCARGRRIAAARLGLPVIASRMSSAVAPSKNVAICV